MDNQNPMNGGMPQGQGQYGGQNTPQPGLDTLENVQTQSVVESAREEAEKELEQVRAYNEALVRQQKAQENATKAKRTSVTIFGVIIFIVLLGVIAWLVVNAIILAQGPAGPGKDSEVIDPAQLAEIDGYKCTTTNCAKVVDLPDGRIIIRDTAYYIYDLEEKEATLTSIEEKDYHAITPFYWGDRLLAELDPESDASALYSITENRALTSYNFDTIYRDINDDVYKNQTSIKGSYIIVKGSGNYRMINVATGTEVVRGTNKVYKYGNAVASIDWNHVSDKKMQEIEKKTDSLAKAIIRNNGRVKAGLKTKGFFHIMRALQKKGWNERDVEYWREKGWNGKKRPWR